MILILTLLNLALSDLCPSGCNCFKDQSGKTFVDCSSRDLQTIPLEFPADVFTIDLSNNNIDTLSELPALEYLLTLNLTQNRISTIDVDAFDDMESLTTLDLSHNHIRFIEADVFEWGPEKLEILKLNYNRLEVIQQDTFQELEFLEEIDLSNNFLSYLHPSAFKELTKLKRIYLHNNQVLSKFIDINFQHYEHSAQYLTNSLDPKQLQHVNCCDITRQPMVLRLWNAECSGRVGQ